MATLADILVTLTLDTKEFSKKLQEVGQELNNFKNHVKQTSTNMSGEFSKNTSKMMEHMDSLSDTTKTTSEKMTTSLDKTRKSVKKVSESSRTLSKTVGTDFGSMYQVLRAGHKEFEKFGQVGNRVSQQVSEEFRYLPKHLQRYVQRLQEAGESTKAFGALNEKYGQRQLENLKRTNDFLQSKTKQSTAVIKALAEQNIMPLSQQFLKLGEKLEGAAKKGSALSLALKQLPTGSMKEIQERVKLINSGLTRMTQLQMFGGIAAGFMVYGMIKLSNAVDGRLLPAFETLKSVWADALTPFIKAFTDFALFVMNGAIALGEMAKKFAEVHPQLSQMAWGFLAITIALIPLLAPLAVAVGLADGLAAAFALAWTWAGQFVIGLLTVAGVAVLIAAAIVSIVAVVYNLWTSSEAFRNAWIAVWNGVKDAFMNSFVTPIQTAWGNMKLAFSDLIATFTGGQGTMSNLWTFLGDHIAVIVTAIAGIVLPILQNAFQLLGAVVVTIINGIIMVVNWMGEVWTNHGTQITAVCSLIWSVIMTAFNAVAAYILSIMPQIRAIIENTFNLIMAIIDFTMKYIAPVVVAAFQVIWQIIQFLMPVILQIIVGTWNNIKAVITATISIIQNVIQLFTNVLKGNWKGAWENVKKILSNALTLVLNLVQLYFMGKLLKPFAGFAKSGLSLVKSAWNGIKTTITGVLKGLQTFIVGVWEAILSALKGKFSGILKLGTTTFNSLKTAISTAVNGVSKVVSTVFGKVKTLITKPIESAKNTVLKIIGNIVSAFAKMKISIPKFKLPSVSVGSKSFLDGKVKVPTFKVNWNAKGAIFDGASVLGGGQGVGEAGAEAVLPISHKRYMQPFSNAVAQQLAKVQGSEPKQSGSTKYEIIFNEPVVIREDMDIQRIVDELERRRKISERAKGVFSY